MTSEGPAIEALTRRLAELPTELADPDHIDPVAVVSDLLRALGDAPLDDAEAELVATDPAPLARARLAVAWLLFDPWFQARRPTGARALLLGDTPLGPLVALVSPAKLISDPDRREELARLCLAALGLRPAGETEAQAEDRARTLDTVERARVLKELEVAEQRAREIQAAMAAKQAQESAPSYSSW
jgi:hypothetical protein